MHTTRRRAALILLQPGLDASCAQVKEGLGRRKRDGGRLSAGTKTGTDGAASPYCRMMDLSPKRSSGQKEAHMRRIALLALAALLVGVLAFAGEIEGIKFPDQVTVGTSSLVLNGLGIRTKVFFKIYIGALYIPVKESDPAKILALDGPKQVVMHFLYKEVGKDKLIEGWDEGFKNNSGDKVAALKDQIAKFNGFWSDMKTGDTAVLTYDPAKGTKVEIKGKDMGTIEGKEFAQALFAIWLGPKPPTEGLKKGMLGK